MLHIPLGELNELLAVVTAKSHVTLRPWSTQGGAHIWVENVNIRYGFAALSRAEVQQVVSLWLAVAIKP
jgi:hypothetical protein